MSFVSIDTIVRSAQKCLVSACLEPAARGEATCLGHPLPSFGIQAGSYAAFRAGPPTPLTAETVLAAMRRLSER